jgi:hypothetical protein
MKGGKCRILIVANSLWTHRPVLGPSNVIQFTHKGLSRHARFSGLWRYASGLSRKRSIHNHVAFSKVTLAVMSQIHAK